MRACFDADGFLLWTLVGQIAAETPAGATCVEVDDDADVNDMFLVDGVASTRSVIEPLIDQHVVAIGETVTLSGLPSPCWIAINGARQQVSGGTVPITATAAGLIVIGIDGAHKAPPIVIRVDTVAALLDEVRAARDEKLTASDWTQTADAPLSSAQRSAWTAYRQQLRALPGEQPAATLETVVWPVEPPPA